MNSLTITQKTSETERYIPNGVITTLYNIGKDDDKHQSLTSGVDTTDVNRPVTSVEGSIAVRVTYDDYIRYLAVKFPNLNISADSTYIHFTDSEVERVLLANGIGDGTGISLQDAANANLGTIFKNNTTIASFNEFGRFNRANDNPSNSMFEGCSSLGQIDQSNITALGRRQFYGTGITIVNMPNLQVLNEHEQFVNCPNLTSVQNLGTITNLSNTMFQGCANLESVTLPATITTLQIKSFSGCHNLKTINLQNISAINNNGLRETLLTDVNINDLQNLVSIGEFGFLLTRISGILNLPKLVTVGTQAFDRCNLITGIECLGKLSTIPSYRVFYGTGVTYVKLPYECTTIGDSAFEQCSSLTSIKQYTDSIDDWVEGVEPTTGPLSRVTSFGNSCFRNCRLLSLTNDDISGATSIGEYAFQGTLLSGTLNLPNLTGILGKRAFMDTQISSVSSLGSVTEIGSQAFANTNVSSITIPNSVKKCASNFVDNTPVSEIIFPEGLEELYDGQFYTKNNSLTYIEIPSTVIKMGIFFHMSLENSQNNLCTVVIKATTPPTLTYYGDQADSTRGDKFSGIYVPDASLTAYQNGAGAWQHSSIQAKLKPMSQLQTDNPTAWVKYNRTSTV